FESPFGERLVLRDVITNPLCLFNN
ncbi:MAG: hypothetical protein QG673_1968, partial [Pseudomonadota bacterium]|nr:hypothetical protein [Pseudomonadota bacterium]